MSNSGIYILKKIGDLKSTVQMLLEYRGALAGLAILLFLLSLAIYAVITIPQPEAIRLWRSVSLWIKNPKNAEPEWVEIFYGKKLPRTIVISFKFDEAKITPEGKEKINVSWIKYFTFEYDDFPSEFIIFFNFTNREEVQPMINIYWIRPDGDEILLKKYIIRRQDDKYYVSNDFGLELELEKIFTQKIGSKPNFVVTVEKGLFGAYDRDPKVLKGRYGLRLNAILSKNSTLNIEAVIYGRVFGIAGTDHQRRPLIIGLLWGTPVALSFGISAALLTTILNLIIGSISGWYGGKIDAVIQRIVEINSILPFLPILILLTTFYKIDITIILISVVLLNIFSLGTKNTRVLVMQIKTYPYIEAAQAYGASNMRLIFLYVIPKILPPVIPGMISSVPSFVFLEAGLSFLGLGDPFLPTWGKIINDAFTNGAIFKGLYYWVLEPVFLLILTAISFALIGMSLEKVVNPRLREL
jgi:peptide/nickel transport system permease protein